MKRNLLSSLAIASLTLCLGASAMAQNIAIVNGKAVPKSRVDVLAQQVARSGRAITPEVETQLKEEAIIREIFMQEAQTRGVDTSDSVKSQLELARQTIIIRELFADYQKKNPVTDEQAKAEYDKYASASGGKEYHAHHILVEKEDQAKSIIAQLKKGAKFEDLAKKLSKDPGSGKNGGDLDWANPASYVKEFSDALMALKKGEVTTTPVKSQFGYHVIRLDDTREPKLPDFNQVKPQIVQQLEQQKLQQFQEELRAKAKVE
ncbi:peptidylprolyl isomerase [Curvibacter sp. CHRR-16]|uniref:peptidylprolyl isomerase n=1 Tax=Curvibacter sp. CHRR-16 TaxID=2835872 RepID=UPI001BDA51D8|nr:peptidylprolyl isomerase [Curvibacter sp. CHRR-16]MBT0571545.1 peptidylprolyl isomerase [Curvibacter sp. CHRR-16]